MEKICCDVRGHKKYVYDDELCLYQQGKVIDPTKACVKCDRYKSLQPKPIKKKDPIAEEKNRKTQKKIKITKQEPWRSEAIDRPKNPFTEKQYQALEKIIQPINGFDLRNRISNAVTDFLVLKECNEEKPRISDVKKNLEKIKKLTGQLSDLLMNETDDETLARLGILENVYNCDLEVSKIHYSSIAELNTLPIDPGSLNPWKTKPLKFYFQDLTRIYEEGTGKKVKRGIDRITQKPTEAYKKILNYFRLCLEPMNPGKKISDGALDSKLKNYLSLTKK